MTWQEQVAAVPAVLKGVKLKVKLQGRHHGRRCLPGIGMLAELCASPEDPDDFLGDVAVDQPTGEGCRHW